jgi:hypothetical protein
MKTNKNNNIRWGVAFLAMLVTVGTWAVVAQPVGADPDVGPVPTASPAPKVQKYPFRGTVRSVDVEGGWIHLEGRKAARSIRVPGDAQLEKEGRRALLKDVGIGDYAKGTLAKDAAGQEFVVKATFDAASGGVD